jgi:hypothetical protein
MRKQFYETKNKNPIVDKVNNYINKTIDKGIQYDYFLDVFPILSKLELTYNSRFFKLNKITPNGIRLSDKELKTISYLAPFYKEKIKYNIKEIIRYLKFLGYDVTNEDVTLMCLDKTKTYDSNRSNYITFEEYLKLDKENIYGLEIIAKFQAGNGNYVKIETTTKSNNIYNDDLYVNVGIGFTDGFTIGWDTNKMK